MRAGQIWQWVYQKGVRDFGAMTNLAKGYRADLNANFESPCRKSFPSR
jgi:23S rRNA (adenine2503-C2)-methyltransferase